MASLVVTGAQMMCSMGVAPSAIAVLPNAKVNSGMVPAATVQDNKPVNVLPFGMCMSMSNPTVASATAAALGVLTPMPCVPNVPGPWAPGSPTVTIGGKAALNDASKAMCAFGGSISILAAGQFTVSVP